MGPKRFRFPTNYEFKAFLEGFGQSVVGLGLRGRGLGFKGSFKGIHNGSFKGIYKGFKV